MRHFPAQFEGVSLSPLRKPSARISCHSRHLPSPGQAVLSHHVSSPEPLRRLMYPVQISANGFLADVAPDPVWKFGDTLDLWGPLGRGFTPPQLSSNWLLVSLRQPPIKLLPLIDLGLERGATMTLFTDDAVPVLPPEVEVTAELADALNWANYLALDLPIEEASDLRETLGIDDLDELPQQSEILISTPMPCGLGACGACAVRGLHSWKRTCIHGPVFDLREVGLWK